MEVDKKLNLQMQLSEARDRLAELGMSPRMMGKVAMRKTLRWTLDWGFTTATLIQSLLGRTSGGYANKLVDKGLLVKTRTKSGSPRHIYTLSENGLSAVEAKMDLLREYYYTNPLKVNQSVLNHNLICQRLTLSAFQKQKISNYETELHFPFHPGKRPDAIWIKDDVRIGVEVELTQKWKRHRDTFILLILQSLEKQDKLDLDLNEFVILSPSKAILRNYKNAMSSGQPLNIWKKNERGYWIVIRQEEIPSWLIKKVKFQLI